MTMRLRWLGQAGFLIEARSRDRTAHVLIDPYLSDSLARKYAGSLFPHHRMHAPPVTVADLPLLTAVLCTHAHTDHMDPDTLAPLLGSRPGFPLVVPRAVADEAQARARVDRDRVRGLGHGETIDLPPFEVHAVASAHEERRQDDSGDDLFLGYVIDAGGRRVYHSGDCVPYAGLGDTLRDLQIDVALLPVNGRDSYRRTNGVPGNFTFTEAVELCAAAGIPTLIPHHWGMFDFNTADPAGFDHSSAARAGVDVVVPALDTWLAPAFSSERR